MSHPPAFVLLSFSLLQPSNIRHSLSLCILWHVCLFYHSKSQSFQILEFKSLGLWRMSDTEQNPPIPCWNLFAMPWHQWFDCILDLHILIDLFSHLSDEWMDIVQEFLPSRYHLLQFAYRCLRQKSLPKKAESVYIELLEAHCIPTEDTFALLTKAYCMCGLLEKAEVVFAEMRKHGLPPSMFP